MPYNDLCLPEYRTCAMILISVSLKGGSGGTIFITGELSLCFSVFIQSYRYKPLGVVDNSDVRAAFKRSNAPKGETQWKISRTAPVQHWSKPGESRAAAKVYSGVLKTSLSVARIYLGCPRTCCLWNRTCRMSHLLRCLSICWLPLETSMERKKPSR